MSDAPATLSERVPANLRSVLELDDAVFNALPMGVYACDAVGRIVRANQRACDLWGRTPRLNQDEERFCGSFRLFSLDGTAIPRVATPMARALHEGIGSTGLEAVVENPDGRRWVGSVNIQVFRDGRGKVVGALNCFQDVTASHRLREQAERNSAFLRGVLEATPECIKIVARDGRLVEMNAAGAVMIGAAEGDDLRGVNAFDLVAPEDRARWVANHQRVCDGEPLDWEFQIVGVKGQRRHMATRAVPFSLPNGESAQLAVTRDVTKHKESDAALRAADARHRQILESLPVPLYTTDVEGRITFYNRAAVEFAGRTPELGRDQWCVSSRLYTLDGAPLAHEDCPFAISLREGAPRLGVDEAIAETPDGRRRRFLPFATPLRDGADTIIGGLNILVDVTQIRSTEGALARRAREQASLYRFTDRLYRTTSPEAAHEAALDALTDALGCERAAILLMDDEGVMRFTAWRGLSDGYRTIVEGHSPWKPGEVDPQPVWVSDIMDTAESDAIKEAVLAEGIRGLGFIPLVTSGKLVGKFMVYYPDVHAFTPNETELAVTIARQLGFSIEQRRVGVQRLDAEEKMRRQAEEFYALADNIPTLCWMAYADGRVYWYNRRWYEYTGTSPQTQEGWGWESVHDPKVLPEVKARWTRSLATGEPFEMAFPLRGADGEYRPFLTRVVPIRDESGQIQRWFGTNTDVALQARQQEHLQLLINELNHRVKNTLATVQSMAVRSFRNARSPGEALHAFEGRLLALSRAHNLLTESNWEGAELDSLVRSALEPFGTVDGKRLRLDGPCVWLPQRSAICLAMVLHELATNAIKYGAWATDAGALTVQWSVEGELEGASRLVLTWREADGPTVHPPQRQGFGSRLIERTVCAELSGSLDLAFLPTGLVCHFGFPLLAEGTDLNAPPLSSVAAE